MGKGKFEQYYIYTVTGAFFLGLGIGVFLATRAAVTEGWCYIFLIVSLMANIFNLAFFQKKYQDFLKSLDTDFTFADTKYEKRKV